LLREQAARFAAGITATNPAPTPSCTAEPRRAAVLADMLGQLDEMAQRYTATADRARVTGLACEKAYKGLR